MKKAIVFIIVFICGINSVFARCNNEDIGRATELAKNIVADYSFTGDKSFENDLQSYSLAFNLGELEGQVYIKEVNNRTPFFYDSGSGISLEPGNYEFEVYYIGCEGIKLRSMNVELKRFNPYSSREECKGLQAKVDICDEWYQGNISEEYFKKHMKKNSPKKEFSFDINFIIEHKWWFIAGFGVLALLGIVFMIRGFKRNKLD